MTESKIEDIGKEALIEEILRLLDIKKPKIPISIAVHLVKKNKSKTCPDCNQDYINDHDCPFDKQESMGFELLAEDATQLLFPVPKNDDCICDKRVQSLDPIPLRPDGRCARCGGR